MASFAAFRHEDNGDASLPPDSPDAADELVPPHSVSIGQECPKRNPSKYPLLGTGLPLEGGSLSL